MQLTGIVEFSETQARASNRTWISTPSAARFLGYIQTFFGTNCKTAQRRWQIPLYETGT